MSEIQEIAKSLQTLILACKENHEITSSSIQQVSVETKYSANESREFAQLINDIKQDALQRIQSFYNQKIQAQKTSKYQNQLNQFNQSNQEILQSTNELDQTLSDGIMNMENKKSNKNAKMLNLINRSECFYYKRRCFDALKYQFKKKKQIKEKIYKAEVYYSNRLNKQCLCLWRGIVYKSGLQNHMINNAQKDIKKIQQYYTDIIKTLRGKIAETDDLIQIKKSAKAEFTYSLNRNLLKTISNLSMEVISLNQVVINDSSFQPDPNTKYLKEVNNIMSQKLQEVNQFRDSLIPQQSQISQKKHKKIET